MHYRHHLFSFTSSLLLAAFPFVNAAAADDPYALLGTSHGGSALWDFCYDQPDNAELPVDPRTLLQPGVSDGKAVYFNTFWKDCHVDPVAVKEPAHPKNCGELRDHFNKGHAIMDTGGPGVAALFTGDKYNSAAAVGGISVFPAEGYNKLWQHWEGFTKRPANFDELVGQRYGSGISKSRNPYPLAGEDPNKTNGGSGNLPEMFTQMRNADGRWSGYIGVTCYGCHSGTVGKPEDGPGLGIQYGGGNSLADLNVFLRDMAGLGYLASAVTPLNLTQTRGTNNASSVNIAFLFPQTGLPSFSGLVGILTSGSTGSVDTPNWWNMGHRPAKFVDGLFPIDAPRVDSVFYTPFTSLFGSLAGGLAAAGQDWMRGHAGDINTWIETQKAPPYPFPIDTQLAEAGAVLFHELNLWEPSRHNTVKKPEGNGSCASCHGAYSPRYTNDTAYLEKPEMEGLAGYIVPLNIIGTDPSRALTNNEGMQVAGARNFFGYPETMGTANDCGPQGQKRLRGTREVGYLTPPLYGVWASGPYMHNGSVPNVWEVLKPQDRQPIWRRVSTPRAANLPAKAVMGFDTELTRAFDSDKLGWKYEKIACDSFPPSVIPGVSCVKSNPNATPFWQQFFNTLYGHVVGAWNILYPPIATTTDIENRKIYNTHLYSQGNQGHAFTSVLTDDERKALIEYMKTL